MGNWIALIFSVVMAFMCSATSFILARKDPTQICGIIGSLLIAIECYVAIAALLRII